MAENNAEQLKRLIDDILLAGPPHCVHDFFNDLTGRCEADKVPFDPTVALEYWWDLARLGVVAISGGQIALLTSPAFPHLIVTERGRSLLQRGENSPHDPPRYLAAVRERIATPDDIAIAYLDESVGAWRAGLYRASAVMLGCACERLVLILGHAIVTSKIAPWAENVEKELQSVPTKISRLFGLVRNCLTQLGREKKLCRSLSDALDRKLSAIFDHARILRNKSGHPTGIDVSADEAEAGLLLFPGFYVLVDDLCKSLSSPPKKGG